MKHSNCIGYNMVKILKNLSQMLVGLDDMVGLIRLKNQKKKNLNKQRWLRGTSSNVNGIQ